MWIAWKTSQSSCGFFAKPGDEKRECVSLQDVFSGVLVLMEHDIRAAEINLRIELGDAPVYVHGNRLRLEQVLVNLIKNSMAAVERLEHAHLSISIWAEDECALLSVEDSGTGFGDRKIATPARALSHHTCVG